MQHREAINNYERESQTFKADVREIVKEHRAFSTEGWSVYVQGLIFHAFANATTKADLRTRINKATEKLTEHGGDEKHLPTIIQKRIAMAREFNHPIEKKPT